MKKTFRTQAAALKHGSRGLLAAVRNGMPAKKLITIGITGTKGKTTTTILLGRLLNAVGIPTGYISTAEICLKPGDAQQNKTKMTTVDPVIMQKHLATMVDNGCRVVVLEISSQGLERNRHKGLGGLDHALFLNLFPEHIEAHGSLDAYIAAKAKLFSIMRPGGHRYLNTDNPVHQDMLRLTPQSVKRTTTEHLLAVAALTETLPSTDQLHLDLIQQGIIYPTGFVSPVEAWNFTMAIACAQQVALQANVAVSTQSLYQAAATLGTIPGRFQFAVRKDQYDVLVDYAHEPESMRQLLHLVSDWRAKGLYKKVIHIVSCDGAGRDDWKKHIMGAISYEYASVSILTTDNYDEHDDPEAILDLLAQDLPKTDEKPYYRYVSRTHAFQKALELAKESDGKVLIVSTGVGNEPGLTQPGGRMQWDEVTVWQGLAK
jgi:UDP-N-acetylmuramoyl-L-alanyl-D-glutamate--2,6-diaminopimelate ligase